MRHQQCSGSTNFSKLCYLFILQFFFGCRLIKKLNHLCDIFFFSGRRVKGVVVGEKEETTIAESGEGSLRYEKFLESVKWNSTKEGRKWIDIFVFNHRWFFFTSKAFSVFFFFFFGFILKFVNCWLLFVHLFFGS